MGSDRRRGRRDVRTAMAKIEADHSADYLLLATNSNPSPVCESEIAKWNSTGARRKVIVRVWRGYELTSLLTMHGAVAIKYGLVENPNTKQTSVNSLIFEAMKIFQACYGSYGLGVANTPGLEAGAALAELVFARLDELRTFGKTRVARSGGPPPSFEWLGWDGAFPGGMKQEFGLFARSPVRYGKSSDQSRNRWRDDHD